MSLARVVRPTMLLFWETPVEKWFLWRRFSRDSTVRATIFDEEQYLSWAFRIGPVVFIGFRRREK